MKTQIKPNTIIAGNALSVLKTLPDNCIDCVMTSPPYWTLRDYGAGAVAIWNNISGCRHRWVKFESQAARHARNSLVQQRSKRAARKRQGSHQSAVCSTCSAWKGQLGLEPTFELYIQHLCAVFDEIRRVLKSSGTCWVNLGDTYAGSWGAASHSRNKAKRTGTNQRPPSSFAQSVSRKSLCLIPFRFAIEMMNRNWILRNVIIWQKPNCLPSSVSDRFTVDFEYLLFFSKTREYYFEPQFEPHHSSTIKRVRRFMLNNEQFDPTRHKCDPETGVCPVSILRNIAKNGLCPAGRNKRCVWSIPTQPFLEPHFATFPEALCDVPIRSSCPLFVCGHCGKPFRRMTELNRKSLATQSPRAEVAAHSAKRQKYARQIGNPPMGGPGQKNYGASEYCPSCACGLDYAPGIVLDPFFGAGTTGLTALKLGRAFLGIELNPAYVTIAQSRLSPLLARTDSPSAPETS